MYLYTCKGRSVVVQMTKTALQKICLAQFPIKRTQAYSFSVPRV
uniref:Uncharacterized protein n=1 Tax=Anguilla anguilla TaxID=7936 RepID=A0A0E9P650_ANGAN